MSAEVPNELLLFLQGFRFALLAPQLVHLDRKVVR